MVHAAKLAELRGPAKKKSTPSIIKKAATLATASAKWIAAGQPVRSDEEIARIFEVCKACPLFSPDESDPSKGTCSKCGCAASAEGKLMNKIAWATEHCPDDPPRW